MDVASLCPLPVGVVRFRSPRRSLTVVVKMSLSLAGPEVALADPQEPLSLDRPFEGPHLGEAGELYYPSDFSPRKARCDVLLVGSARALEPASVIQARLRVGELDRRFVALSGAPSPLIPLRSVYLREGVDPSSKLVTTAPLALGSPERPSPPSAYPLGLGGVPTEPLAVDFDYGVFNAAPRAQQVSVIRTGGALKLDGLLAGKPSARLDMPSDRPRVYCPRWDAALGGGVKAPLTEVLLRCDTLWIDVDRALCSMTWRGEVAIPDGAGEPPFLVVTLAPYGLNESVREVEARVLGASKRRAVEASDLTTDSDEAGRTALPFRLPPELLARSALPFRPSSGKAADVAPKAPTPAVQAAPQDEPIEIISDEMIITAEEEDSATRTTGPVRLVGPSSAVFPFQASPPQGPKKR